MLSEGTLNKIYLLCGLVILHNKPLINNLQFCCWKWFSKNGSYLGHTGSAKGSHNI